MNDFDPFPTTFYRSKKWIDPRAIRTHIHWVAGVLTNHYTNILAQNITGAQSKCFNITTNVLKLFVISTELK